MAETQEFSQMFGNLNATLGRLQTVLGSHNVAQGIALFDGEKCKFSEWIKTIEKNAFLSNLDQDAVKRLAFQTSRGSVSDYIQRRLRDDPSQTWDSLKKELSERFGEVTDPQYAFTLLKELRQLKGQSVQGYAEALITLANEAFTGTDIANEYLDRQLVGFFIDGLLNDSLKYKLLRDNPGSLQEAIELAVKEDNLKRRFKLRIGEKTNYRQNHEPMEVDHARRRYRPTRNGAINATNLASSSRQTERRENHDSTARGSGHSEQPVCRRCGKRGHLGSSCRSGQSDITCYRCHRRGHMARECRNRGIPGNQ